MRIVLSSFIICSLAFVSCRKMQVGSSVNVGQLADTYAELLVLNERFVMTKDSLAGQRYAAEYQGILQRHNFTKEEYTSQFEIAASHAPLYRELCDRALKKLQTMRTGPDTTGMRPGSLRAL